MPPLTAGVHEIEEAIQQLSHIRGPRPPTALGGRDERLQQAELVVRQCLAGAKIPTRTRLADVYMAVSKQKTTCNAAR